jgi:tRNA threonylcarbamoyladenosine modification (KEOPS) complex  Pcc1 subunit
MSVSQSDGKTVITIKARDATAFRAIMNSTTQMISVFESTGTLRE